MLGCFDTPYFLPTALDMDDWHGLAARLAACLWLSGGLLVAAAAEPTPIRRATADEPVGAVSCTERDDEVWLVSTRHLSYVCGTAPEDYALDVRRHQPGAGWVESTSQELAAATPLPLVVYVHGNRVNWCDATPLGWRMYESLVGCGGAPPRIRFVIWTWPSDQIRGPVQDVRVKAERADWETFFLGAFLAQVNPATPVRMIGYSYGSRIIAGGLHLQAGGQLYGVALSQQPVAERIPCRVVMLAPAMSRSLLYVGSSYDSALDATDRFHVLYNSCDPALQRYRFVERCSPDEALGYTGVPCPEQVSHPERLTQTNVASWVGRDHSLEAYLTSGEVLGCICDSLFGPLPTGDGSR